MTSESDNLIHDKSKVNLRSEIAAFLGTHIAVIRGYFGKVAALAAYRDQALYEALYHCGDAMGDAIEQPDVFKTIADAGGAKGRDIPTRFIDLATKDEAGESTLNDERRASYAAAAMWFATRELTGEDIEAGGNQEATIAKARELGGIDGVKDDPSRPGIVQLYRRHREACTATRSSVIEFPATPGGTASGGDERSSRDAAAPPSTVVRIPAKNNKRYTANDCARDVVLHFADQFVHGDTFIDPCAGQGAFYHVLSQDDPVFNRVIAEGAVEWCEIDPDTEITRGCGPRNFLEWQKHVTWGITNPPWSADAYGPIFRHALEICDNIVFLIRQINAEEPARRKEWEAGGFGLREIAMAGWRYAGFPPEGRSDLAAVHWQRGYKGDVRHSKIEPEQHRFERYKAALVEIVVGMAKLTDGHRLELREMMMAEATGFPGFPRAAE